MDRTVKIVVSVLVLSVGGFFVYSKIAGWHQNKLKTAVKQQRVISQRKADQLEQKVAELEQELDVVKGQKVPEEKLAQVFGENNQAAEENAERQKLAEVMGEVKKLAGSVQDKKDLAAILGDEKKIVAALGDETNLIKVLREEDKLARVLRDEKKLAAILQDESKLREILAQEDNDVVVKKIIPAEKKRTGMADIERQIMAFFSYLDAQSYIQAYEFAGGSYLQYQIAVKNLSSQLPIIIGEMQSLYRLVLNVAHFYRVMGKQRIFVTRQMLQNESEIIESVMKTFYQWYTMDGAEPAILAGRPSPGIMYEYAGYILNTLGGRSYLLRRSPKVRA
ncbi:MAG: hypothetical protein GY850_06260, partial [bacterium]|nr:hypothetical protein [bacterium]